jgi:hypothetical protein
MSYNATGRTPANGAVVANGSSTMTVTYNMTGGAYIYRHKIFSRKDGGSWGETTATGNYTGSCSFSRTVTVRSGNQFEWYVTIYWVDGGGNFQVTTQAA